MLATPTGAAKEMKRDRKLSTEPKEKPKLKDPAPKSSKSSKGKKRKGGEGGLPADPGAEEDINNNKAKKGKNAHVDVEETAENSWQGVLEADQPKSKKSKNVEEEVEDTLPESSTKATKHSKNSRIPAKQPSPEPSENDDVAEEDKAEDKEADDSHLHGFSTDNDDSSDEEDSKYLAWEGVDLGKLPTIAKDDATVKRKLEKAKRQKVSILYLWIVIRGYSICLD